MLFPSVKFAPSSDYEIPVLEPQLLASSLPQPYIPWGSHKRYSSGFSGCYHFFCDDRHFSALWNQPKSVSCYSPSQVMFVEPDFSIPLYADFPVALYQMYRRRYLGAYWQSLGFSVIPNLSVDTDYLPYLVSGIPSCCRVFATSGIRASEDLLLAQYDMACLISDFSPTFAVYGGGRSVGSLCRSQKWLHFPFYRGGKLSVVGGVACG